MKARWKIGLAVGVVGLIAVGWILLGHTKEPRYQGRPVSYWFKQFYLNVEFARAGSEIQPDSIVALQKLGTNALPYLVREALSTKKDSALRTNYYKLLEKLPASWHLPKLISRDDIRDAAAAAINEINPPASAILPLLQPALDSTNAEQHGAALDILSNLSQGRETLVPVFARALRFEDEESQKLALEFLHEIGPPGKAAVPDLIEFLKRKEHDYTHDYLLAAEALGKMGQEAASAVTVLKEGFSMTENYWEWRVTLATAICQIDGRQTGALDFIVSGLKATNCADPALMPDSEWSQNGGMYRRADKASFAAHQLGEISTNAASAIPELIKTLDGTNALVWIEAGPALKRMGAPKELYLPILEAKLKLANDGPRARLALNIMEIEPGNAAAQAALIELIRKGSPYGRVALDSWCETDRAPREAIPVLHEALKSGNASWREVAATALKQIEAQEKGK